MKKWLIRGFVWIGVGAIALAGIAAYNFWALLSAPPLAGGKVAQRPAAVSEIQSLLPQRPQSGAAAPAAVPPIEQPRATPYVPQPIPPERREVLTKYHEALRELKKNYHDEKQEIRIKKNHAGGGREEKQHWREERKAIMEKQREEIAALREQFGVTAEEEKNFMVIELEEKRQAILSKKQDIPPTETGQ